MGIWMWNGGWIFGIWDLGFGIWDYEDSMRIVMVIGLVRGWIFKRGCWEMDSLTLTNPNRNSEV